MFENFKRGHNEKVLVNKFWVSLWFVMAKDCNYAKYFSFQIFGILRRCKKQVIAKLQTVTLFRPIRSLQCSW